MLNLAVVASRYPNLPHKGPGSPGGCGVSAPKPLVPKFLKKKQNTARDSISQTLLGLGVVMQVSSGQRSPRKSDNWTLWRHALEGKTDTSLTLSYFLLCWVADEMAGAASARLDPEVEATY